MPEALNIGPRYHGPGIVMIIRSASRYSSIESSPQHLKVITCRYLQLDGYSIDDASGPNTVTSADAAQPSG
jgi:hypothetical protein